MASVDRKGVKLDKKSKRDIQTAGKMKLMACASRLYGYQCPLLEKEMNYEPSKEQDI
jgi:hypothetical protein